MENENKKPKKGGWTYKILPFSEKKKAVDLFLKGETPLSDIAKQYGVAPGTISQQWTRQVRRGKDRLIGGYKMPTNKLRLKVVREVLSGGLTIDQAMEKYDIAYEVTIQNWIKKFSSQIVGQKDFIMPEKKSGHKSEEKASDKQKELERALEDAKLKIIALETMINIAEEQFKIDIRKKPGTKQLE